MHSTFAVTPRGLPLGILSHRCWAREGFCQSEATYEERFFCEKESYKWVEALNTVTDLPRSSMTTIVHVADRESDIYEFLREAHGRNTKYVIRACYDRTIESVEYSHIQEQLQATPAQAIVTIDVPSQKRRATLSLTFQSVTLRSPTRIPNVERISLPCWVVHVKEQEPPEGTEALSWTLLTNVPTHSIDDALLSLSWYRRRWSIEEFHKILKSGCTVEDCRLQTADRLKRYLALFCVIAWRIFWMVHIQRANPTAPAEVALTQSEIGTLRTLKRFHGMLPKEGTLTVKQVVIAIARLGGYLNRKNDPPPGPTALWRGWQRLSSMTEVYDGITGCG